MEAATNFLTNYVKDILNRVIMKVRWRPTSLDDLEASESKILSRLKTPFQSYFVNIGPGWGLEDNFIWTLEMNSPAAENSQQNNKSTTSSQSNSLPLVMIHGFGSGVGLWSLNLDSLSSQRKVFAFDVLGFGRSSRPNFSRSEIVEHELIESLERWRKAIGLNQKFILLGHSFGAYLSLAYALRYPTNIAHIILADPWGIPAQQTAGSSASAQIVLPTWVKIVARVLFTAFTPLAILRAAGPYGPSLIQKVRPDLKKKFEPLTGEEESNMILDYIYHCNAQDPPSGEIAFKSLARPTGWAKNPMIQRVGDLDSGIDLTFIYGSRSWIDRQPAIQIKHLLSDRAVQVHVIGGAGHHVYADNLETFNSLVNTACAAVDDKYGNQQEREKSPDSLN